MANDDPFNHAVAVVLASLGPTCRSIAERALRRVEERRGGAYSFAHHNKRLGEFADAARRIVATRVRVVIAESSHGSRAPTAPTAEIDAYEHSRTSHAMRVWRQRIDSDAPAPMKPESVLEYERACETFAETVRAACDLSSDSFQAEIADEIARTQRTRPRSAVPRRKKRRGVEVRPASFLVGGAVWSTEGHSERKQARQLREMLRARADALIGHRLVFGEELPAGDTTVAARARQSERGGHEMRVQEMVGVLNHLGYVVYPGDVGIEDVYAMADLVALRDDELLFVECLSKASVKRGAHEKKLALAEHVPFCFVGELPDDFVASLPPTAYAITHPHSACLAHGPLVPYFWRTDRDAPVVLDVSLRRGRKLVSIGATMPILRRPEEVAGFVWACLAPALLTAKGWERTWPRARVGRVPFDRVGMPDSSFRMKSDASDLLLRLGRLPMAGELRGTRQALDAVLEAVRAKQVVVHETET